MVYIPNDVDKSIITKCRRRKYSEKTIKTYLYCIHRFLNWCKKDLRYISKKDVRLFLENLSDKGKAGNTLNVYHMAIKFLFEDVMEKKMWINIKYSKIPKRLPVVLSKEEIKKLFNAIDNEKHLLMAQLMYGSGLRVSELSNLKIRDLDLNKNYGFVRSGKGNKDRIFIVANKLKDKLKNLISEEKLEKNNFLFVSNRNKRYNSGTIRSILLKAGKKAHIDKRISPHVLRHSFATQLIRNGYSVLEVQSLLGHKSPETTFIYLHTASPDMIKVRSPFDEL